MEPQCHLVAVRVGGDEIVRKGAMVMDVDEAGRENEVLTIDLLGSNRHVTRRFGYPNGGDRAVLVRAGLSEGL